MAGIVHAFVMNMVFQTKKYQMTFIGIAGSKDSDIMPTDIEYFEQLIEPFTSYRNVEVYGGDQAERMSQLPRELGAVEESITEIAAQIKAGNWATVD